MDIAADAPLQHFPATFSVASEQQAPRVEIGDYAYPYRMDKNRVRQKFEI
jgi:hypothetical protein